MFPLGSGAAQLAEAVKNLHWQHMVESAEPLSRRQGRDERRCSRRAFTDELGELMSFHHAIDLCVQNSRPTVNPKRKHFMQSCCYFSVSNLSFLGKPPTNVNEPDLFFLASVRTWMALTHSISLFTLNTVPLPECYLSAPAVNFFY